MCMYFALKGQHDYKPPNGMQDFLFEVCPPYHPPGPPLALRLPAKMRNVSVLHRVPIFFKLLSLLPFQQELMNSLHFPHSTFQYILICNDVSILVSRPVLRKS